MKNHAHRKQNEQLYVKTTQISQDMNIDVFTYIVISFENLNIAQLWSYKLTTLEMCNTFKTYILRNAEKV